MTNSLEGHLTFARLSDISPDEILAHMSDLRVAEHMPLLTSKWDHDAVTTFIADKEECWRRDGLGHWAIRRQDNYVGWGGFQKEGEEWDFGLVLKPENFGLGVRIVKKAIALAVADTRIPFVTFLLPPSRKVVGSGLRKCRNVFAQLRDRPLPFLSAAANCSICQRKVGAYYPLFPHTIP